MKSAPMRSRDSAKYLMRLGLRQCASCFSLDACKSAAPVGVFRAFAMVRLTRAKCMKIKSLRQCASSKLTGANQLEHLNLRQCASSPFRGEWRIGLAHWRSGAAQRPRMTSWRHLLNGYAGRADKNLRRGQRQAQ